MLINHNHQKKEVILNTNETIMKTKTEKVVKINPMKEKTEMFNFSPSEFAFGFESCKRCYYDKKVNNIVLKVPFPGIFSKFDLPAGPGVRTDTCGYTGYASNPSFDSLVAKVISQSGYFLIKHLKTGTVMATSPMDENLKIKICDMFYCLSLL